jgi:hypothetical protein
MQLPYIDRFETIWEYEKLFLSGQIDFCSSIGERCPICGGKDCYRARVPYWRYAIKLFPEFKKKRIPISTLSMAPAPEDLLFVAHPVNPLLSVHGRRRGGDPSLCQPSLIRQLFSIGRVR